MGVGVIMISKGVPMLLQGQGHLFSFCDFSFEILAEFLTYDTFNFPIPPPLNWTLANSNAGIMQEVADLIAVRTGGAELSVVQITDDDRCGKLLIFLV